MAEPYGLCVLFTGQEGQVVGVWPIPARALRRVARAVQFRAGPHFPNGCSAGLKPFGCRRGALPVLCAGFELALAGEAAQRVIELTSASLDLWVQDAAAVLQATSEREASPAPAAWLLAVLPAEVVPAEARIEAFSLPGVRATARPRPAGGFVELWPDSCTDDEIELYVEEQALQAALHYCEEDPRRERGGVLLGSLYSDERGPWAEAVRFIPAEGAPSHEASMCFDQRAWAHIHRERARIADGPDIVSIVHSHPPQQTEAGLVPLALRPSAADRNLMAAYWAEPHLTATIIDPASPGAALAERCAVWGWDRNAIGLQKRGCSLVA